MADLNIPNLNKKSDKYIFKKRLSLRRKSKRRLFIESGILLILSFVCVYLNYLIPNKNLLFQNLPTNLINSFQLLIDLSLNLFDIFLVIFTFISYFITLILFIGSISRLIKIINRKTWTRRLFNVINRNFCWRHL